MDSYPTEANDTCCLGTDEARALLAGAPWRRLLVMGDSIAAGIGDPVDGYLDCGWADRLAAALIHVDFLRHPADDGLLSADRLHINRRGHAIVAAEVIRSLSRRLDGLAVQR